MAKNTLRRFLYKNLKDVVNFLDGKSMDQITRSIEGTVPLDTRRLSVHTFYSVYRNHGDTFAVIRELSENTGSEGYDWVNAVNPEKEPNIAQAQEAERIFNQNQTFRRWKSQLIQDVGIAGNAYVQISKTAGSQKPFGLNFLDPRYITVITDKYGSIIKWIYKPKGTPQEYDPEEIAHFYLQRDPNSPVFGLSSLEPIFWEVRTDQKAMVSNYVFFENNGVPAAQYIIDPDLTNEEKKRAVEAIRNEIKGAENRHKSVALEGVIDIKTINISQKEMEFHLQRTFTTEKVCAAYGVPKSILNYTDSVNLANGKEQSQKFWEGTIRPLEDSVEEFINKQILPRIGVDQIKLEFRPRDFENREWNEASSRADQAQGVMTINEVRQARGLEPFDSNKYGEFVDAPFILNGAGAVPLEDLGVDLGDVTDPMTEDQAEKEIARIKKASERYLYGHKTDGEDNK